MERAPTSEVGNVGSSPTGSTMHSYKLVNKIAVPCPLSETAFGDGSDRRVAEANIVSQEHGNLWVSTVFLGLDHNRFGDGPPHLFETMVFSGGDEVHCERCSTWEEAEAQHHRIVADFQSDSFNFNPFGDTIMTEVIDLKLVPSPRAIAQILLCCGKTLLTKDATIAKIDP